jgi:hypothetical protein
MKKSIIGVLLASMALAASAQTENPRGIYKMTTLTGKLGEVKAPFEQYKICTDSVTLMVTERAAFFNISDNDHQVFNYTGEQPKSESDKSPLIYDSNDKQFKLKWWSNYAHHIHFPNDDWCIEKYESGQYTEMSKVFFDALTGTSEVDANNPLSGTWRFIGYVDELRGLKKELPKLHKQYQTSKYFNCFIVFTPQNWTMLAKSGGTVDKIEYYGKKSYKVGSETCQVKWLSKDRIAVEEHIDYRTDWMILERVTDGSTPLSHIASQYIGRHK